MTQEEKVRAYDEAVKKVKDYYEGKTKMYSDIKQTLDLLFPELKENVDEWIEKIRKDIISYLNNRQITSIAESSATERWVDWIEKQGESDKSNNTYVINNTPNCGISVYNEELKESENESIRKLIIRHLDRAYQNCEFDEYKKEIEKCISWLEKQGEQKPVRQKTKLVYHKFNIGDVISPNVIDERPHMLNADYTIVGFDEEFENYLVDGGNVPHCSIGIEFIDDNYHLKEQEPMVEPKFKVGDWITNGYICGQITDWIINGYICRQITNIDDDNPCYKIRETTGGIGSSIPFELQDNYHLWTIEDANDGDVLFHSDTASNGIFIFKEVRDDKVLCHCDFDSEDHFRLGEYHNCCWVDDNIKPATKEQRELLFQKMKEAGYEWDEEKKELIRIESQGEQKQKNSEELTDFENAMMYIGGSFFGNKAGLDPNDTKKVKEQAKLLKELIQKPQWSEEDERIMNFCISRIQDELEVLRNNKFAHQEILQDCKEGCWECIDWLKSLKQRMEE